MKKGKAMKELKVAAGILIKDEKVLCAQRGLGKYDYISYKFEFPGGKVEKGETGKEALVREMMEEMDVCLEEKSVEFYHRVFHEYKDFKIEMECYICKSWQGNIILKEHLDKKWLAVEELMPLDWATADIPVVEKLVKEGW